MFLPPSGLSTPKAPGIAATLPRTEYRWNGLPLVPNNTPRIQQWLLQEATLHLVSVLLSQARSKELTRDVDSELPHGIL